MTYDSTSSVEIPQVEVDSFKEDFKKLADAKADLKFFFLTEKRTYELMKSPKYRSQLTGVQVVLLTTSELFNA